MAWWSTLVLAGAPAPVEPTPEELAQLSRGEVVIRPPARASGEVLGMVDVSATQEQVWNAVMDFDARVKVVKVLDKVEKYAPPEGWDLGVTFHLSVLGTSVVYHLVYDLDPGGAWCSYTLDPTREHGVSSVEGSYLITPVDAGHRITYRSQTDTGRFVPGFVQRMLTSEQLRSQLESMRVRAPTL